MDKLIYLLNYCPNIGNNFCDADNNVKSSTRLKFMKTVYIF